MAFERALRFFTKVDNSKVQKDLDELKKKIEKTNEDIGKDENAKLPLTNKARELGAQLDEAVAKLEKLKAKHREVSQIIANGSEDPDPYIDAVDQKPKLDASIKAQDKVVAELQKRWDSINDKIDQYDLNIQQAKASIEAMETKAGELSAQLTRSERNKLPEVMDKARAAAGRFEARIVSLGKRILVFSLVATAFRAIKNYMDKLLKSNAEFTAELADLKGALATAFQPIYEILLPGLLAAMRIATAVVRVIAHVLSLLTGKTSSQSAKNAEALNKEADAIEAVGGAAKKANKDLAGFDEINRLGGPDAAGGGGASAGTASMDFSDFNTEEYKSKIDELTVYLSGALLALGAILAFSGANIPLGIGLMAAGAVGLAAEAKANWGTMDSQLKKALTTTLGILGGAMLVLGAILAFSGANIPKGIALMALGAASLAGAAAINWNTIVTALQGPIGEIVLIASGALLVLGMILALSGAALPLGIGLMVVGAAGLAAASAPNWNRMPEILRGPVGAVVAIGSAALLALGLILAFSGAGLPLGIALIAMGATGLVTVGGLNWNAILDKMKETWANVKEWFTGKVAPFFTKEYWVKTIFDGLREALPESWKAGINAAIDVINRFISWVNRTLTFSIPPINIAGQNVFGGANIRLVNLPTIPRLAQGAVIPPNREFLAVLGDQSHGTNVEAPLSTIQEAVAIVMEDMVGGMMAGFEALLEENRLLREVVESKEIGDEAVYRANKRYTEKINIIRGRV